MKLACAGLAAFSLLSIAHCCSAQSGAAADDSVRINQIQVIGTHNSYHAGLQPGIATLLNAKDPDFFATLDYAHASLAEQLDHGVRQIELDVYADTKGGRFAHPFGPQLVSRAGLPANPDPYADGRMLRPGFKVQHVQDIDFVSNCQPFVACLRIVRDWSKAHPGHIPIFILVETVQRVPPGEYPWAVPEPFTPAIFDALDAEIRSVFGPGEMVTPDRVRGRHRSLNQAILHGAWPTLAQARGKAIFLLDQDWAGPIYMEGHAGLRGRILFTNATPGRPDAAFVEVNEVDAGRISSLVRQGYLVRTRSDADTVEARTNSVSRRDQALASGAQIVSTDYPAFESARWTGYFVALPDGGPARCNPVTANPDCRGTQLESFTSR